MKAQAADRSEQILIGDSIEQSWQRVRDRLRLEVGQATFEGCLKSLALSELKDGTIVLAAETPFMRDWVKERHTDRLRRLWQVEFPSVNAVDIIVEDARAGARMLGVVAPSNGAPESTRDLTAPRGVVRAPTLTSPVGAGSVASYGPAPESGLDPEYSFATFVTAKSNALAYEAARRVAESDVTVYNPLFIYGPSGVGKTHLMQAIGNTIAARSPERRVQIVHSEVFLSKFMAALRAKDTLAFKDAYRSLDVLLVDDFHYIVDKQATVEELFHTLQVLITARKQVVITADGPPGKLDSIGERIKSWLGGGMTVDVQATDYDLRLAILKSKVERYRKSQPAPKRVVDPGPGVLELLADQLTQSVRDLEGALTRILGNSELLGVPMTVDAARVMLKDILKSERPVTIEDIMQLVAHHYDVRVQDIKSPRRTQGLVRARHVGMWLAREVTQKSYPQIALRFGGRDHTTVISAVSKIDRVRKTDPILQGEIDTLLGQLRR